MGKYAFAGAALLGVVGLLTAAVSAQEVKQETPNRHRARQRFLRSRSSNSTRPTRAPAIFSADQRQLRPDALLSRQADRPRQRQEPARRLDLPDRRQGIAGDFADRGRRRDVCDDVVQPRLRARRQDRRSSSGTTITRWDRSRPIAAVRTIAASRFSATSSMSPRSTPSWSPSMPRPARWSGRPTSPIRNSATARRWRRPWSRTRS